MAKTHCTELIDLVCRCGIASLLLGRIFCGWICPLGALNEFISMIALKLGIKRKELPSNIDRPLRFLKYIILAVILFTTWKLGTLTFRAFDPWASWMHLSAGISEAGYGTAVLFATLFLGIFIERFLVQVFVSPGGSPWNYFAPFTDKSAA